MMTTHSAFIKLTIEVHFDDDGENDLIDQAADEMRMKNFDLSDVDFEVVEVVENI